eukprot:gene25140-31561_t
MDDLNCVVQSLSVTDNYFPNCIEPDPSSLPEHGKLTLEELTSDLTVHSDDVSGLQCSECETEDLNLSEIDVIHCVTSEIIARLSVMLSSARLSALTLLTSRLSAVLRLLERHKKRFSQQGDRVSTLYLIDLVQAINMQMYVNARDLLLSDEQVSVLIVLRPQQPSTGGSDLLGTEGGRF